VVPETIEGRGRTKRSLIILGPKGLNAEVVETGGPEKIEDQGQTAGSLMILITKGLNAEVVETGGPEKIEDQGQTAGKSPEFSSFPCENDFWKNQSQPQIIDLPTSRTKAFCCPVLVKHRNENILPRSKGNNRRYLLEI